jgi:hypothetical protein
MLLHPPDAGSFGDDLQRDELPKVNLGKVFPPLARLPQSMPQNAPP